MRAAAQDVDDELEGAGVLGDDVLGAIRLGHDGEVGTYPALQHVDGARAALQLSHDGGDPYIAPERDAGTAGGHRGHDHRGIPALHVVDAGAVEAGPPDRRRPGGANPAPGNWGDVDVTG